ncbi:MAG: T9SS type A sorting domain-containing protein, partial [Bacteroidales bacterium]|nr:T9SS type A sorting domain-containing protein [Bacteroidales bacterium]
AAPLKNVNVRLTQPDGQVINCFASGDEFYNYLHDAQGFTIVQGEGGYYYYATYDAEGKVVPSAYVVDTVDPATVGLKPNTLISTEEYYARRHEREKHIRQPKAPDNRETNHGLYNNMVVFIRFAGDSYHTTPMSTVEAMFNADGYEDNSLHNYYHRSSYNQLDLRSHFYPQPEGETILSYEDIHTKEYYMPYDPVTNPEGYHEGENADREFSMLARAIAYVEDMVPDTIDFDYNNDGLVDNVVFVIKGRPGEWASLLWPHRWSIYDRYVPMHDLQVFDFNLQLEIGDYFNVSTLCHEMCHSLGAPDLYHYNGGADPAGAWDLMCGTTEPPQQEGIYMKYKYGNWVDEIPDITGQYGTYELEADTWEGNRRNAYKIQTNNPHQYFVVEYRDKNSLFDSRVPGRGMLIYRIDDRFNGGAGYNGYDTFDEVYIFRPGGNTYNAGNLDAAFFSPEVGRVEFNNSTDPHPYYTNGQSIDLEQFIYDIKFTDNRMSFTYGTGSGHAPSHFVAHVNSPAQQVELSWEAAPEAASYNVYCDGQLVAEHLDGNSYAHPYADADDGYHTFSLRAVGNDGLLSDAAEQWVILGDYETFHLSLSCDLPHGTKGGEVEVLFNHPSMKSQHFTLYEAGTKEAEFCVPAGTEVRFQWLHGFDPESKDIHIAASRHTLDGQSVLFDLDDPQEGQLAVYTVPGGSLGIITPQNLTATPEDGNTRLSWTVPTENTLFKAYRDRVCIEPNVSGYTYLDNNLLNSGSHHYHVADASDEAPIWDNEILTTVMTYHCEPPQNLQGTHYEGSNAHNELSWEAPTFIGHGMIAYDDNRFEDQMGSKKQVFAIKVDPGYLVSFEGLPLTHIEMFDCSAGPYTYKVYNGEEIADETLLYSQTHTMTGSMSFVRFALDEEVAFDSSLPLWICAEPDNVQKPVPYGAFVGEDNSCMIRMSGNWRPITYYEQYHSWLLRAYTRPADGESSRSLSYRVYSGPEEADDYQMEVVMADVAMTAATHESGENLRYNVTALWNGKETSFSNSIFLGPSVSVEEEPAARPVALFPNPSRDRLTVQAEGMTRISVVNLMGQEMESRIVEGNEVVMDLSQYAPGLYLVKVDTESGSFTERFVKEL